MLIIPYQSVGSLSFGVSLPIDCVSEFGQPQRIQRNRLGVEEYYYPEYTVRFNPSTQAMQEVTLLPHATATVGNIDVSWDNAFLQQACILDGNAVNSYGFIVLPKLGLAVTGIHDDDDSQLAITVFAEGIFDSALRRGIPFDHSNL